MPRERVRRGRHSAERSRKLQVNRARNLRRAKREWFARLAEVLGVAVKTQEKTLLELAVARILDLEKDLRDARATASAGDAGGDPTLVPWLPGEEGALGEGGGGVDTEFLLPEPGFGGPSETPTDAGDTAVGGVVGLDIGNTPVGAAGCESGPPGVGMLVSPLFPAISPPADLLPPLGHDWSWDGTAGHPAFPLHKDEAPWGTLEAGDLVTGTTGLASGRPETAWMPTCAPAPAPDRESARPARRTADASRKEEQVQTLARGVASLRLADAASSVTVPRHLREEREPLARLRALRARPDSPSPGRRKEARLRWVKAPSSSAAAASAPAGGGGGGHRRKRKTARVRWGGVHKVGEGGGGGGGEVVAAVDEGAPLASPRVANASLALALLASRIDDRHRADDCSRAE